MMFFCSVPVCVFCFASFVFSLTSEVFEQKKLEFQSNYVQHSVRGGLGGRDDSE
jgi:hypothetical protein